MKWQAKNVNHYINECKWYTRTSFSILNSYHVIYWRINIPLFQSYVNNESIYFN